MGRLDATCRHQFLVRAVAFGLIAMLAACGGDSSANGDERGDDWRAGADAGDALVPDGGLADGASMDADGPVADTSTDVPPTSDAGTDGEDDTMGDGLTEEAVANGPWYGVIRLTESPGITGNVQELNFSMDGSVSIGVRANVTGSWEVFDDDSVRLYELVRQDGSPNEPSQFVLEAEIDDQNRLAGFELFLPSSPDGGGPYTVKYERLEPADAIYSALQGRWLSTGTFTGNNGNTQRLEFRFTGDQMGYGVAGANGGYFEVFRGNGHVLELDNGRVFWMSLPPDDSDRGWAPAGEIEFESGEPAAIFGPRAIDQDGQPGPDDWQALRMEPAQ